ncbi:MAG TPA: FG-GAP-like repeat-containing protein [Gemmata sp.]
MTSPMPVQPPRRRWPVPALVLLLVAGAAAYLLWARPKPPPPPPPEPDLSAATSANLRGVGYMEQFDFAKAEQEFADAARLAPDWLPARVNLGIAMFNQQPANNRTLTQHVEKARDEFRAVLARDPNHPHAHYCLGILDLYITNLPEAYEHFVAVNKTDPDDAHTWLRLGSTHPDGANSPAALRCFDRALTLNPYLNEARYRLAMSLRGTDPARLEKLLAEHERLRQADRFAESRIVYGEMGKYADVIGRDPATAGGSVVGPLPPFEPAPNFKVALAPGARWALAADLDPTRKAARERFGATVVLADFTGDGKPDALLLSAVVEGGKVRDLLLRNEGNGTFTDVTAQAGLAAPRASLGAAAGDYDNDGRIDLVVTSAGGVNLFRNAGDGTFADVTAGAKLEAGKGVYLGCSWLDIDQDGDLDLIVCKFADGASSAFSAPAPGGGLVVFENVGVAPPAPANGPPPGLSTAFQPASAFKELVSDASVVNVVATDIDADRDTDLVVLSHGADPAAIENDRLMRFKRTAPAWGANSPHLWNGGCVLDANHDERSDLFLLRAGAAPVYLLSKGARDFVPGATNSPPLKQAVAADIDLDGWPDVVGLSADGKPVLLHNRADGRLEARADAFGIPGGLHALAVGDLDGDGNPDLLTWADGGLQLHRNLGNGNRAVLIDPTGRREKGANLRTNNDGIGSWLSAQTGSQWTGGERTTLSAGLGQSVLPTALGIGKQNRADLVRVQWPDLVLQAELGVNAGGVLRLAETNRKGTSCPVLMAWDGERFAFVTDFLGGGALGESGPDGSVRPPRPEESVKIEPHQLVPKDGHFVIKIAEPMDEVLYLDHLRLAVLDHPADLSVFPDERFVFSGPEPTQKLLAFRTRYLPKSATDHHGRDVTQRVLERDRRAADTFAVRSWLGFAEDHSLALDFGAVPPGGAYHLVLAGWTEYPYPESMFAATRAGVAIKPPVLEQLDPASGKWEPLCDLGFPAGLPRVMTRALPPLKSAKLRISTNMQVYWDQIYLAAGDDARVACKVTSLEVSGASLAARGFVQEVYPEGRLPVAYDDAKTEPVAVAKWKGRLTRLGDVTELLRAADDRFVLCGPGDEITVRFDVKGVPALPVGWKRSFVLQTRGYCKDTSTTTVTGGSVGPLPFRTMPNYPNFGTATPPVTDADRWHSRPAGGK